MLDEVRLLDEIDRMTYDLLWSDLSDLEEEELDWRPHPQANSVRWKGHRVRHVTLSFEGEVASVTLRVGGEKASWSGGVGARRPSGHGIGGANGWL